MRLYLNIETTVPAGSTPRPDLVEAPSNYTKKETIEKYQKEHAESAWLALQTKLWTAKAFRITYAIGDGEVQHINEKSEAANMYAFEGMCHDVFEWMTAAGLRPSCHCDSVVAWNGRGFDFPMLLARAVKYELPHVGRAMLRAVEDRRFGIDPWVKLGNWGTPGKGETLDAYADFYGCAEYNPITDGAMAIHLANGRHADIEQHTTTRITMMRNIVKKMERAGVL